MKVLIADDDPVALRLLGDRLAAWGYDVVPVNNGDQAWACLEQPVPPPLTVLDWMMPGRSGLQVTRDLRGLRREPYVYVIVLSARSRHDDLLEAMEAGADDYVAKPFDPHELRLRLRAGRRITELQQELVAMREELRSQATHDALTGLWNRPAILDALIRELERSEREGKPFSLVLADIDYFKSVNDRLGHLAGDAVLAEIGRRLASRVRPYDLVGRYGGEEFLILLPGCDSLEAQSMAHRLCREASRGVTTERHPPIRVTLSLGITTYRPGSRNTSEDLIRAADAALYAAKDQGRNRAILAS